MTRPLLTVCIPAYNRAADLAPLLRSILSQDFDDWNCVIAEDNSRERDAIRGVVEEFSREHPRRFRYHENVQTLGYDGNFRRLVELADGHYVFVMGNDDLVYPGAFRAVARGVQLRPDVGVILRAYAFFRGSPDNVYQITRYYAEQRTFEPGLPALVACYRRLVAISGLVLHRDSAHAVATSRWDGTLFYQHWLAANILCERSAVYVPDILALFRKDGVPEFGNAAAERGLYTPGLQPPSTDVRMLRSLVAIAEDAGQRTGIRFVEHFKSDYAHYMYPTLAHQAHEPWPVFWRFYRDLGAIGFDRYVSFHAWFWLIVVAGASRVERIIQFIRRRVGHTPNLTRGVRSTSTLPRTH